MTIVDFLYQQTMTLSPEEIEKIAQLARLELSDAEKAQYAEQLSVVLEYMKILDEVDTSGVEETCQVTGLMNVAREDVVEEISEEARANIIKAFPQQKDDYLQVQAVFGKE